MWIFLEIVNTGSWNRSQRSYILSPVKHLEQRPVNFKVVVKASRIYSENLAFRYGKSFFDIFATAKLSRTVVRYSWIPPSGTLHTKQFHRVPQKSNVLPNLVVMGLSWRNFDNETVSKYLAKSICLLTFNIHQNVIVGFFIFIFGFVKFYAGCKLFKIYLLTNWLLSIEWTSKSKNAVLKIKIKWFWRYRKALKLF